jgi:ankyrin repeat protein
MLDAGVSPDSRDTAGYSALALAVDGDTNMNMVRALLSRGANPNLTYTSGNTLLMVAADQDESDLVEALVNAGARVDLTNPEGGTALLLALRQSARSSQGLTQSAAILATRGVPSLGSSTLVTDVAFQAVERDNPDVLEALLAAGMDPNVQGTNGSPIITSVATKPVLLGKLLQYGAQPDATDPNGETALLIATRSGAGDSVSRLIQSRANPNLGNPDGFTPLMAAASLPTPDVLRTLLLAQATVWPRQKDGSTALHFAAESGTPESVRVLLTAGSDVNATNTNGDQPVHLALINPQSEQIIQILVTAGATPPPPPPATAQ